MFDERLALIFLVLLLKCADTFAFFNFKFLQFLSVVHRFINSLVDSDQLFIILHRLKSGIWLDLGGFNGTVKFSVQSFHLLLMVDLQALNFFERLLFIDLKALLPFVIEFLHMLLSDSDVLTHLCALDVSAEFVLILDNLIFQKSDFLHQVLIKLILMYFTTLFSKQLHFFLDHREDQHLLIFVKNAVAAHIKHIKKLLRRAQSQQVKDMITSLLEHQTDIRIIQQAFLPEVGLLDSLPDFLAFASTANQRPSFLYELTDFVTWDIGEGAEGFLAYAASRLIAIDGACV